MQAHVRCRVALLLLLLAPATVAGTDEYWTYSYRNVDVTAAGNGAYAVNLAHYVVRLDELLSRILTVNTQSRLPTHFYVLPQQQLAQFLGDRGEVSYKVSRYDNTVLMASTNAVDARRYWSAYFGYTATLLQCAGALHGPYWYLVGVPAVFADSVFEGYRVKIGNLTPGFAYTLYRGGALIPMRAFLALQQDDARLQDGHFRETYEAEAWYLARQIFVESMHRAEFAHYLTLLGEGKSESDAFAASFKITYEDLDKELVLAMRDRAHVYIMEAPEDDAAAQRAVAQRISVPEWKARLAALSLLYKRGPDPVQLSTEALQADPTNESALRTLARAQLEKGAYAEALRAVDKLAAQSPSAQAWADSAIVLAALARGVSRGDASLPVDAAILKGRAREDFERAIAADSAEQRSRDGLAALDAGK